MIDRTELLRLGLPLALAFAVVGCGGGDAGDTGGEEAGEMEAPMENPVDPATAGTITGMVTFTGTPPEGEAIDMSEEPVCADKHETPPMRTPVVVGPEGGLARVFVYVKSGLADLQFPTGEAALLDQVGCRYEPHVLGVMVGQNLTVQNSDDVLHNVKATPEENRGFNRSQPTSGMTFETSFAVPEVMIPVQCDVHGWMQAFVGVTDHPYHAVSSEDGSFSLERLPPGEYEIEAWHEHYGTSTQMVTVPESGEVEVAFEFSEEMAGRTVPMGPALIIDHENGTLRRATEAPEK